MKNDLQIQRDVIAELDREPAVDSTTIGVEVHHGVVKLAGSVRHPVSKDEAERAAHRVSGVTAVVVDIDIVP
jgi:osmotically-inducible protein OsmY